VITLSVAHLAPFAVKAFGFCCSVKPETCNVKRRLSGSTIAVKNLRLHLFFNVKLETCNVKRLLGRVPQVEELLGLNFTTENPKKRAFRRPDSPRNG
jgi:hypothetical protein